jgi:hypothetical protein
MLGVNLNVEDTPAFIIATQPFDKKIDPVFILGGTSEQNLQNAINKMRAHS